jgi:hypothetical protein
VLGAALEQAVGEAAGRGADVERPPAGHRDAERVEGVGQLDPAAGDERGRADQRELHVVGDELTRLLRPATVGPEHHLAGQHRRGGPRARGEGAALGEQVVEAHALHLSRHGT